jgi:hypothetical protein
MTTPETTRLPISAPTTKRDRDPVDPVDPVRTVAPTAPVAPTDPVDPVDPAAPIDSIDAVVTNGETCDEAEWSARATKANTPKKYTTKAGTRPCSALTNVE